MRFGLVHRAMTDALAFLGVLSLVVGGQFSRPLSIFILASLALAIGLKEKWRQRLSQRHVDAVSTAILIATQLGRAFFTSASVLDLLIEFAVGLQVIRVATRNGAAHDQQVIVLALLHLIAGTVVGGGLGYGLCLLGLIVVTPGALVLSHLRREVEGNYRQGARDRTGLPVDVPRILRSKRVVGKQFIAVTCLLALPILLFTATLFVVFPRVGLSLLLLQKPRGERMIGFSGTVNLGQIGTLRSDPTIALRVTIPNLPDPPPARRMMYLRGTALDQYDGRTWTQSSRSLRTLASAGELVRITGTPAPDEAPWRVELEPFEPPVLFVTPTTKAIELSKTGNITPGLSLQLQTGPEGEFRYQAPSDRMVRYDIYPSESGEPNFTRLRGSQRGRYLEIADALPPRIAELAAEWTRDANTDFERAKIIESRLRTEFEYDLASPSGSEAQPLDHFLFESKRGHCEYFSSAMAVMLRSVQVPARNVTGFVGGTYNKYGRFYAVRQGDAHSWVEAFIEGRGWLSFDPTPPGSAEPQSEMDGALASFRDFFEAVSQRWNQNVLGYDLAQQVSLFDSLDLRDSSSLRGLKAPRRRVAVAALGLALVGSGLYWLYRRRRRAKAGSSGDARVTRDALTAARLYRLLDRAMAAAGVRRFDSVPPLGHALALERRGHPLSSEIRSLTERYLAARFGNVPLTDEEQRDFERRARWLQRAPHGSGSNATRADTVETLETVEDPSKPGRTFDPSTRRHRSHSSPPATTVSSSTEGVSSYELEAATGATDPESDSNERLGRRAALETPVISINVDLGDEASPPPSEVESD